MKIKLPKNTANVISVIRIFLTAYLWYLIYSNQQMQFFYYSLVTFGTDILDGFVARTFKLESDLGRNLDTFGDIIFFPALVAGTIYFFSDFACENLTLILFLLVAKTFGYITVAMRHKRLPTAHLRTAQTWGWWLMLFVVTAFLYEPQRWIIIAMTVHAFIFSIEYILFCNILTKKSQENIQSYFALKKEIQKESEQAKLKKD